MVKKGSTVNIKEADANYKPKDSYFIQSDDLELKKPVPPKKVEKAFEDFKEGNRARSIANSSSGMMGGMINLATMNPGAENPLPTLPEKKKEEADIQSSTKPTSTTLATSQDKAPITDSQPKEGMGDKQNALAGGQQTLDVYKANPYADRAQEESYKQGVYQGQFTGQQNPNIIPASPQFAPQGQLQPKVQPQTPAPEVAVQQPTNLNPYGVPAVKPEAQKPIGSVSTNDVEKAFYDFKKAEYTEEQIAQALKERGLEPNKLNIAIAMIHLRKGKDLNSAVENVKSQTVKDYERPDDREDRLPEIEKPESENIEEPQGPIDNVIIDAGNSDAVKEFLDKLNTYKAKPVQGNIYGGINPEVPKKENIEELKPIELFPRKIPYNKKASSAYASNLSPVESNTYFAEIVDSPKPVPERTSELDKLKPAGKLPITVPADKGEEGIKGMRRKLVEKAVDEDSATKAFNAFKRFKNKDPLNLAEEIRREREISPGEPPGLMEPEYNPVEEDTKKFEKPRIKKNINKQKFREYRSLKTPRPEEPQSPIGNYIDDTHRRMMQEFEAMPERSNEWDAQAKKIKDYRDQHNAKQIIPVQGAKEPNPITGLEKTFKEFKKFGVDTAGGGEVEHQSGGFSNQTNEMPLKGDSENLPKDIGNEINMKKKIPVDDGKTMAKHSHEEAIYVAPAGTAYSDESNPHEDSFYLPHNVKHESQDSKAKAEKDERVVQEDFGRMNENVADDGRARPRQNFNTGEITDDNINKAFLELKKIRPKLFTPPTEEEIPLYPTIEDAYTPYAQHMANIDRGRGRPPSAHLDEPILNAYKQFYMQHPPSTGKNEKITRLPTSPQEKVDVKPEAKPGEIVEQIKRGRGRPKGTKNKPKAQIRESRPLDDEERQALGPTTQPFPSYTEPESFPEVELHSKPKILSEEELENIASAKYLQNVNWNNPEESEEAVSKYNTYLNQLKEEEAEKKQIPEEASEEDEIKAAYEKYLKDKETSSTPSLFEDISTETAPIPGLAPGAEKPEQTPLITKPTKTQKKKEVKSKPMAISNKKRRNDGREFLKLYPRPITWASKPNYPIAVNVLDKILNSGISSPDNTFTLKTDKGTYVPVRIDSMSPKTRSITISTPAGRFIVPVTYDEQDKPVGVDMNEFDAMEAHIPSINANAKFDKERVRAKDLSTNINEILSGKGREDYKVLPGADLARKLDRTSGGSREAKKYEAKDFARTH